MRSTIRRRRGVTVVESAIVLAVCLLLLLGMLELSLALIRHTVVCEAARRVARTAVVHGSRCGTSGPWGPTAVSITAADSHPAAAAAEPVLMTLDPADVQIDLSWPDGINRCDGRVRVTVHYTHHPIVPIPGWYDELDLRAESTMRIAH